MSKRIDASHKILIWRSKMSAKGFTKEDCKQFENDVFNGYIAEDIAKNLSETKNVLSEIEKSSRIALLYFIVGFIIGICGIIVGILYTFMS